MRRREKAVVGGGRVAFEASEGRRGGTGIFGLEEKVDDLARQAKLQCLAEEIVAYDRGYEGPHRRCPRCGQEQRYRRPTGSRAPSLPLECQEIDMHPRITCSFQGITKGTGGQGTYVPFRKVPSHLRESESVKPRKRQRSDSSSIFFL